MFVRFSSSHLDTNHVLNPDTNNVRDSRRKGASIADVANHMSAPSANPVAPPIIRLCLNQMYHC